MLINFCGRFFTAQRYNNFLDYTSKIRKNTLEICRNIKCGQSGHLVICQNRFLEGIYAHYSNIIYYITIVVVFLPSEMKMTNDQMTILTTPQKIN